MGASRLGWLRPGSILWALTALNIGAILYAGLRIETSDVENGAEWSSSGEGIEFARRGIAYTDQFSTQDQTRPGFALELAITPRATGERESGFIAVVYTGDETSQLLVWQWRQSIIVMNGDDYDHRRREPRLSVDVSGYSTPLFLQVSSEAGRSVLYLDGSQVSLVEGSPLQLPTDRVPGRLILGNNAHGNRPWHGTIAGIAVHSVALDTQALRQHLESWRGGQGFAGAAYVDASLSFALSAHGDRRAADQSFHGLELRFPRNDTYLDPEFFSRPAPTWQVADFSLNLAGFVPLGFCLAMLRARSRPTTVRSLLALTIAVGFVLSFAIEWSQAWFPSRHSSVSDLVLNVVGTGIGAMAFVWVKHSRIGASGPWAQL